MPLDPRLEDRIHPIKLLDVLVVQSVVVVIVLSARDELLERLGAVLSQREILDVADLTCICTGQRERKQ